MNIIIRPSDISGTLSAPPSKSEMQRVTAAALLAEGKTIIEHPSHCEDAKAALHIVRDLGAEIVHKNNIIKITGGLSPRRSVLHCGEAGLSLRMFSAIAALSEKKITLKGEGSLRNRPVDMIEKPLQELGARCSTHRGLLPITVQGPLTGGTVHMDGSVSSQFLTGMLMALPVVVNDSEIFVTSLKSKPYIDMTLQVLHKFSITVENKNYEYFRIPGNQKYIPCRYPIEGDWSGAAFLLVAGAIAGEITVNHLNPDSPQADKLILDALKTSGSNIAVNQNNIRVSESDLRSYEFDATDCPDLFPPLVALAAHCRGTSIIKGVSRLKYKESDRATVLQKEFAGIGINISIDGDVMAIQGGTVRGGNVHSHNDHRIAMAGAVAALKARNKITIEDAACVSKSYPGFYNDLKSIGGIIHE